MAFNLPSIRTIGSFASSLISQIPFFSTPDPSCTSSATSPAVTIINGPSCPINGPISCQAESEASCCFVYPGGQLLQTQFWDANPSVGPDDKWTLHGLWPDLCDGSYDTFCTSAPQYHNITSILTNMGSPELLADMEKYWLPNSGTNEHFWQHEWNKHGTCINTLSRTCYDDDYKTGVEVVDFFDRAVELFKTLDTYAALAAHGILPSYHKTYTSTEIQAALTAVTGSQVVLGCNRGRLNQAWYSFHIQGSLQSGNFVPSMPAGKGGRGNCPRRGIRYVPK